MHYVQRCHKEWCILKRIKNCKRELEHSLRIKLIDTFSTEEYINALGDIVTRTKIGRTLKNVDIKSQSKPYIKKEKQKQPFKANNNNEDRKFHKCDGIGHLANNCLKKEKINEIAET
ncbi:hypothetical protein O181_108001 [Austropuccinia psidii MF-1]|uniref:Uncharacterized protein n=1 Tax=Austropuccinia psidii MF-1 TaxID=1389203 RepID=A0A9Q3JUG7_9BASI|nr:hypothetical protein [Austropuccinia psidii MF-1]